MTKDLSRLLRPRSIAVLGGAWAANAVRATEAMGYDGDVWPVHPKKAEVAGRPAFPSLAALPAAPDAAFVAVNRDASVDVMSELAAMGAGGAVSFASGFTETGDGDRQAALVAAAGGMPMLGPNCYGVINYIGGETWAQSLKCLKRDGRMLTCGATAGAGPASHWRTHVSRPPCRSTPPEIPGASWSCARPTCTCWTPSIG